MTNNDMDTTAAAMKELKFEDSCCMPKKTEKKTKKSKKTETASTHPLRMEPPPGFLDERIKLWEDIKVLRAKELSEKQRLPIKITLPDGKCVEGTSWETTPEQVAIGISKGLADATVISKVNGVLWDIVRPFESDATLELLKFEDSDEAKAVFWHSSAHILGEAMECHYGGHLCYGPPIQDGYFYDMHVPAGERTVTTGDHDSLNQLTSEIVKEKQPFERLELTKAELLEMFKYNEFKCRIINERITTERTTAYRCGPLIDLCRGPHVPHTGRCKVMQVVKNSAAYWEGKADREVLQRVYGISFPDKKQMSEWKKFQEAAAQRNHRKIGIEQELFFFDDVSPGSCFFLPHGARIYNRLISMIKDQYRLRGFDEVVTPNVYNSSLWKTSGHWDHYSDNMFQFECEKEIYGLKPMNCPGHCLMFKHRVRSWRELPLRLADFGVLHRNELSGALTGLIRVRRFQQDDAHIFCMMSQISDEIDGCLDFLRYVYEVFGFTFQLKLSTRPEGYLGELDVWNRAEKQLEESLNKCGLPWELNPGDGAFYGPKIDITICDALRRSHQCATIQLDFQQPIRFDLHYQPHAKLVEGEELPRPVIIHRAILGSVERMIAILTESCGGKWPFWLSPRQVMIISVDPKFLDYAVEVRDMFRKAGFDADADETGATLKKKIRSAQLSQYNYILVVGESELEARTVNVRTRDDNAVNGMMPVTEFIDFCHELVKTRSNENSVPGISKAPIDENSS